MHKQKAGYPSASNNQDNLNTDIIDDLADWFEWIMNWFNQYWRKEI